MFKTKFTKITKLNKEQLERVKGGTVSAVTILVNGNLTDGIIIGDVTGF